MSRDIPDPSASGAFCILPWMHLEIMPEGACKACCVAQEPIHEGGVPLNVAVRSIAEIRGSDYMRSVRQSLASNQRISLCSYCWDQERRGETSLRQGWTAAFPGAVARLAERTRQGVDSTEPLPLEYLQVSFGNTCNLACRMCNGSYSSRIAEDPVHGKWSPHNDWAGPAGGEKPPAAAGRRDATRAGWAPGIPWFDQEVFLNADMLATGASLTSLYVTGGEPLMSDSFTRLLDEYAERGQAKSLAVSLNSNLFHNEARFRKAMESLLRFAGSTVGVSIDGHGPVYEYIRYPARWDIVERNIHILRALSEQHPQLRLKLDTVAQPYNCLNLTEILGFADELGVECYLHVIEGPSFLRMQVVPREARRTAAERLRAYAASPGEPGTQARNRQHALRVARHFETIGDGFRAGRERRRFAEFTRALDASRQQRLEESVPELARFFR